MAGFNTVKPKSKTKSYEGGIVYKKNPVEDFVNFVFSSKMENAFYEKADAQRERFEELIEYVYNEYGARFLAKCAMFTRNELGNRTASQFVAAWLNDKSFESKRMFYREFCHRPDDVSEMFAMIDYFGGKRSHAIVRGCGDYLSGLGEYQLGKYKMNNRTYNMFDLINITHATSRCIDDYKNDKLAVPDTWEVAISMADASGKASEWRRLVEQGSLGYLALIRNLNNIMDSDVDNQWVKEHLVPQILNEQAIRKSLVYPYQIYVAYKNLRIHNLTLDSALGDAFAIAVSNMKPLEGKSVIMLDVSGSMDGFSSANSAVSCKELGACYAAALYIAGGCDFVKFGDEAKTKKFNRADNPFTIIKQMCENDGCGYGTDIRPAFRAIGNKDYDRIFLVSDMQIMERSNFGWFDTGATGPDSYNKYVKLVYHPVKMYSFDVSNYATQLAPASNPNVHLLTTMSDKIFDMIPIIENGGNLVDYIESQYTF